jgi:hypothetical protein
MIMENRKMKKLLTVFTFLLLSVAVHAQAWAVAGGFNGWNNAIDGLYDDGTHGDAVSADGIFTGQVTVATAGRYEWKATLWGNWGTAYPANNSWILTTAANQVVTFTLNTNTYTDTWFPKTNIVNANDNPAPVVAAGTHQSWNNAGSEVMHDDGLNGDLVAGDGIYTWHTIMASPGNYGWKPVYSGTWDAWGADNRNMYSADQNYITTEANQNIYFYLNKNTGRISVSAQAALRLNFIAFVEGLFNPADTTMVPDTLTVELRDATSPYSVVNSKQVLLTNKGEGTVYFNNPNDIPYWIVLKHRNSVETWSWNAVTFAGSIMNYDFTWTQGAAYTDGGGVPQLIQVGSKWCIYSGDVNQDGGIDIFDLSPTDNDNVAGGTPGVPSGLPTDVNGDGGTDIFDLSIIDNNNSRGVYSQKP